MRGHTILGIMNVLIGIAFLYFVLNPQYKEPAPVLSLYIAGALSAFFMGMGIFWLMSKNRHSELQETVTNSSQL